MARKTKEPGLWHLWTTKESHGGPQNHKHGRSLSHANTRDLAGVTRAPHKCLIPPSLLKDAQAVPEYAHPLSWSSWLQQLTNYIKPGFLNRGTTDILGPPNSLLWEASPCIYSSIPGLYPLQVAPLPPVWHPKMPLDIAINGQNGPWKLLRGTRKHNRNNN